MPTDPLQFPEAYAAAVYQKDVEAFLSLYASDIRIFDAWGAREAQGLDHLRDSTTEWFGSLGEERVVVSCENLQHTVGDAVAVLHALIEYKAVTADGQKLRAMQERGTWALEKRLGGWLVVHQHTSHPADFRTGAVMESTP